jgi:hypothetical protein
MPGMSQELSWTLVNLSYMAGSYLMFHYVRGVPFDFNSGAFDNLNMWEQIDNGDQYTPAKKFLLAVPIVLFLVSTHYTHYDSTYFVVNCLATLAVVLPKLPSVCPGQHTTRTSTDSSSCTGYDFPSSTLRQTMPSRTSFDICIYWLGCNNACIFSQPSRVRGSIKLGALLSGCGVWCLLIYKEQDALLILQKRGISSSRAHLSSITALFCCIHEF